MKEESIKRESIKDKSVKDSQVDPCPEYMQALCRPPGSESLPKGIIGTLLTSKGYHYGAST
ncbi:hypothetical protein LguiA_028895 [Lonicera macranthoides]